MIFSVGGGFVVNEKTKVDENLFYKGVDKSTVPYARLHQSTTSESPLVNQETQAEEVAKASTPHPPYPFESGDSLLALTKKHNVRPLSHVKK